MVKKIRFQVLEPRILLDAAGMSTADAALEQARQRAELPAIDGSSDDPNAISGQDWHLRDAAINGFEAGAASLVVVDTSIEGYEALIANLPRDVELLLIDEDSDGVRQIADYVTGRDDLTSIHILSHGQEGGVRIGASDLNTETLEEYSEALRIIGASLTEDGDILIYGCDVAEGEVGINFITELALLTDADIAASDDATGNAALGGDWLLEGKFGTVDVDALTLGDFAGVLPQDNDPPVLDAIIAKQDGQVLELSFTEANQLDVTTGLSASDFTVTVNGNNNVVTGVSVDGPGKTVTLTLTTAVDIGDDATVDFSPSVGGAIQDNQGNGPAADIVAEAVLTSAIYYSTAKWVTITPSGTSVYDYLGDQQTGQQSADIVGTDDHPAFQIQFDNNGVSSNTDGTLSFRWRLGDVPVNYYYVGIDANLDGDIDVFVVVTGAQTPEVAIWGNDPGSLNISPSTTGLDNTYEPYVVSADKTNYAVALASEHDPGTPTDLDGAGDPDYFVSISIPFQELVDALAGLPSPVVITDVSALRFVQASATQGNSFNQDIGGLLGGNSADVTYASSGTFSDPQDASGNIITPPGAPVLNDLDGDNAEYVKGSGPVIIDQDVLANVTDSNDSVLEDPNTELDGGIRIFIKDGVPDEDVLGIDTSGTVSVSSFTVGGIVSVNGTAVGEITNIPTTGLTLLSISFNQEVNGVSGATLANVNKILQAITYDNSNSVDPDLTDRNVFFFVNDGSLSDEAATVVSLLATERPTVETLQTNDPQPTLTGTYDTTNFATLTVALDGTVYIVGDGHLTIDGGGNWSLDLKTQPITPLSDGTYSVTAKVTDTSGNILLDATSAELLVDTAPPLAPTVVDLTTGDATPIITGTYQSADTETLTVTVDGVGTYTLGVDPELTAVGDNWTLNLGGTVPPLTDNTTYQISATATDAVGNSASDNGSLILIDSSVEDITPPVTPVVDVLVTSSLTPTITGSYDRFDADGGLVVTVNGVNYTLGGAAPQDGAVSVDGSGNWSLDLSHLNATALLADTTYDVTVTVTDQAGNAASDSTTGEVTVDQTGPSAPTVDGLVTRDRSPTITGTYDDSDAAGGLSVTVNGNTYTLGSDPELTVSGSVWSLALDGADVLAYDTVYEVVVTATDQVLNSTGDVTSNEVLIVNAAAPTVDVLVTTDSTPVVTGTSPYPLGGGEQLDVTINGVTYLDVAVVADGSWTKLIPPGDALADGTYNVDAVITKGGNPVAGGTDVTSGELTIDTQAPTVPTVNSQTTDALKPIITGKVGVGILPAGESLTVVVNGGTYKNVAVNGSGSWTVNTSVAPTVGSVGAFLNNQTYSVTATVTDQAGNASTDVTSGEIIIDRQPPVQPTVDSQLTQSTTPTLTGTATLNAGEILTVTVNGVVYEYGGADPQDSALGFSGGVWSLDFSDPNAGTLSSDATYEVLATVTDAASLSSSDSTSSELVIDNTPPSIPTVNAQVTSDTTPVITGTWDSADSEELTVTVNGVTYTLSSSPELTAVGNNWTLTIPSEITPDGSYQVVAKAVDEVGNTSTDSTTNELTIDANAPVPPTVNSLITNDTTPLVTGNYDADNSDGLIVTVNGVAYVLGTDPELTSSNGTWSLNLDGTTPLGEGVYNVIAQSTDHGNTTTDVTTSELTVDTTPPSRPTVVQLITSDNTPVMTGTFNSANAAELTVTVDGVTYTLTGSPELTASGNNWFLQLPSTEDGTYQLVAYVTDAAGNNSGADVTLNDLTIDASGPATPTANVLETNDQTPILSGSYQSSEGGTLSVTVNGVTYTKDVDNELSTDGDVWTLDLSALGVPLGEGPYPVTVVHTGPLGVSGMARLFRTFIYTACE